MVDEADALPIGDLPEHRCAEPAEAERNPEEQPGDGADLARHQLLAVDDDGGERRGQHQPDDHAEDWRPEQVGIGQHHGERQNAEDRAPDHRLAADPVADRPADQRAHRHRAQEDEQVDLGFPHRHAEGLDQVEGVVAADRGQVDVLREHQGDQQGDGDQNLFARQARPCARRLGFLRRHRVGFRIPLADAVEDDRGDRGGGGEPRHRPLTVRYHDQRGEQRPERLPRVAADLEHRLREAEAPARGHPRDPRGFRVKHRRADADHRRPDEQQAVASGGGENQQADEGRAHPGDQRKRFGVLVGVESDHRLQQRGGELEGQGEQADLAEIEAVVALQHRIDRGQERLHHVVQHVAEAQRDENGNRGGTGDCGRRAHLHHSLFE